MNRALPLSIVSSFWFPAGVDADASTGLLVAEAPTKHTLSRRGVRGEAVGGSGSGCKVFRISGMWRGE